MSRLRDNLKCNSGVYKSMEWVWLSVGILLGALLGGIEGIDLAKANGCSDASNALSCNGASLGDLSQYTIQCASYVSLTFDNSGITNIPSGYFDSCTAATTVTIRNDAKLGSLPSGIFYALKLETLQVTNNKNLTTVGSNLVTVSGTGDVDGSVVSLASNSISSLGYPVVLGDSGTLSFNITRNNLNYFDLYKAFSSSTINTFSTFKYFDLSHNNISSVGKPFPQGLSTQKSLNFDLSYNQFVDLSEFEGSLDTFCTQPTSCVLNLNYNHIESVPSWMYRGQYSLYLDGNPFASLEPMPRRPGVKLVSLQDTKNLHFIPMDYLENFDPSSVIFLGEDLSCCGIGKSNLELFQKSSSTLKQQKIVCLHKSQKYSFYAPRLITVLSDDPTYCTCENASCAPENPPTVVNATCKANITYYYTTCDCSIQKNCYLENGLPIVDNTDSGGGSNGTFSSSVAFYVIIACVLVVIFCSIGGFVFWRFRKQKKAKETEHEYSSSENYYDGHEYYGDDSAYRRGSKGESEKFDELPPDGHGPVTRAIPFFDEEFPERLGQMPEVGNFVFTDDTGLYLGINANLDNPPEVPSRNDEFTSHNVKKLSVVDRRKRVNSLLSDAAKRTGDDDIYDPIYLEEKMKESEERDEETSNQQLLPDNDECETKSQEGEVISEKEKSLQENSSPESGSDIESSVGDISRSDCSESMLKTSLRRS